MNIGLIGLGKMGNGIARRLMDGGHTVFGFDPNEVAQQEAIRAGVQCVSLDAIPHHTLIILLMVPVGAPVDDVLHKLIPISRPGTIIIDGGNSNYKDSIRRAQELAQQHISFLDCGTSGGLHGQQHGYCLMVGGDVDAYKKVHPLLTAIACQNGIAHIGPSGAGHYVKMIHNGIEYALLEAYAEGFQLIKEGNFKEHLDSAQIAFLWNQGSIIRSWLLQLTQEVLKQNPDFANVSGAIAEGGTGQWTVDEAKAAKIPVPVIEKSLSIRAWSRETDGNYATKLIALLRHAFGGHAVQYNNTQICSKKE